jgi:ABC-type uncharacterized transport system involved in gliding motility auxiliary subunit
MNETLKIVLFFFNGILYLATIGLWLVTPEEKTINYSLTILALLLTSALTYQTKNEVKRKRTSWQIRHLSYGALNFTLVLVIVAFLNYLSFKNAKQIDVSEGKINSLTEQTVQVVKGLKSKLGIKIFARNDQVPQVMSLVELYRYHKSNLETTIVDPDKEPQQISQYQIDKIPAVVMEYENKIEKITEHSELNYTNSLIRLKRDRSPKLLILNGHGEIDMAREDKEGGLILFEILKSAQFDIEVVNILEISDIEKDIDGVVIWGPRKNYPLEKLEMLDRYLHGGGRILLALDPTVDDDKIATLRNYIANSWGIAIPNHVVVDLNSHVSGSNGSVPLIKSFNTRHPITKNFIDPVFFPLGSNVYLSKDFTDKGVFKELAFTTDGPKAWADSNPTELISGKMIFNSDSDIPGPVAMAGSWEEVLVSDSEKESAIPVRKGAKIVAFGNSTFIQNVYAKVGGNYKFFLASLSWLLEDDLIESFNLPTANDLTSFIVDDGQRLLIFYVVVVVIPVLFLIIAWTFKRKRSLKE